MKILVSEIAKQIEGEVNRAMVLHPGTFRNHHEAHSVILEEFEEYWEQVKINPRKLSVEERLVRENRIRAELIQTAAMCVRAIVEL
jgi:hypothetical protein